MLIVNNWKVHVIYWKSGLLLQQPKYVKSNIKSIIIYLFLSIQDDNVVNLSP